APNVETNRSAVLHWLTLLKSDDRYYAVMVFDRRLDPRLALPASASEPPASVRSLMDQALQSRDVVLSDLHQDQPKGVIHLDIVFPIFEATEPKPDQPLALVLLKLDARQFLFPLVQSWPTPSSTAETLLVRREGKEVLYLNDLRHRPGTALALRAPLSTPDLPAAQILRGDTNVLAGVDYRGVPVVAVGRLIPGTSWAMVAKVDRSEIYAPLRQQVLAAVAVLGALLVASALLVVLLWHQRSAQFLARELAGRKAHERDMHRMNRLYAALSQVNQAVVRAQSPEELRREVCRVLVDYGGFQMSWIGWVDPRTARVMPLAQYGDALGYLERVQVYADERAEGRGPVGTAIRENRACVCNAIAGDPRMQPWHEAAARSGWCSLAAFPIRQEGRIRGTLAVYASQCDFFGPQERGLLEETAVDLSFGLENLRKDQRRHEAEAALRQSEAQFRTLVEAMPQLVWTCQPDGACDYLSRRWMEYTGTRLAENLGSGWLQAVHPEDMAKARQAWEAAVQAGEPYQTELRLRSGSGQYRWHLSRALALRDEAGRVTKWFGTCTDITAVVEAREALARSHHELERLVQERTAQLVEANANLQSFAHSAAHDLRSPLRGISSFTSIALQEYGPRLDEMGRSLLQRVVESAELMGRLLNDLLEYSKLTQAELPLARVSLEEALREVLALLEQDIQAKQARLEVAPGLPAVIGHPATVVMLICNLAANALKFMPPGSQPQVRIWAEPSGADAVRLNVQDNGIGIARADLGRMFGAFQRLNSKQAYPGTGLGLAIVRKGAERMGGRVGVESELGKGSRFWVELKAA
ncbi:MAG TPA: ATP-binding protein, partial [Candidatus Sulfotelmatobacter sp.]|nr:ATP-binding protein [Candidatus Sulfotelmatobacter sp.]